MIQVTPSKQWIHFFLSDLWPPTSNILHADRRQLFWLQSSTVGSLSPAIGELILHCRFTGSGGLWRRTGSRWYRWSSLLIAAHPAQWARSLAGLVAPGHSGSWGGKTGRSVVNNNMKQCDNLSSDENLLSSRVVELVLWGPVEACLYASVLPEAQNDFWQLFRHGAFLNGVCQVHEFPGIVLQSACKRKGMCTSYVVCWKPEISSHWRDSSAASTCWSEWP